VAGIVGRRDGLLIADKRPAIDLPILLNGNSIHR
jgi:hypothetical protein